MNAYIISPMYVGAYIIVNFNDGHKITVDFGVL